MRSELNKTWVMRTVLAAVFGSIAPLPLVADCRAPNYRLGHIWEDSPSTIMENISIRTADFAPERPVCLAAALRQRYSSRKDVTVLIFSSYYAAKHYTSPSSGDWICVGHCGKPPAYWAVDNHASYSFDADKHVEEILLTPLGQTRAFATKINLPVATIPPCTLELAGRCLLSLANIEYPGDALKAKTSGRIVLKGVISRDGRVEHILAVNRGMPPGKTPSPLSTPTR
jgi:hypothetical protein